MNQQRTEEGPDYVGVQRKRAVLYLRVSTPSQVNTDYNPEGISIPAQRVAGQHKAESLDADIVREFIEPGKTATSIDKRPVFQELIAWIKAQKDIDYLIVYHFNRVFRDAVDAGMVKRDLKKYDTRIVSTVLDMGESPEAAMIETIIHAVDQYQSQASGADIKYKMGQKAKNGGTIGRARLGYLNVREAKPGGGEIRTVVVDEERAPYVQLAFELYATGEYTHADLADDLYDRGLRTRPTARHPEGKLSINKISLLLRDRYYLGYVSYGGEEYKGRHEPLIDLALFERVQTIAESRSAAQERRRIHHHYLKGSLFCGRCHSRGIRQQLILQHSVNRHGTCYAYFFCGNKQHGTCRTPYVSVLKIEDAIEEHYATVRFTDEFKADARRHVAQQIDNTEAATRLRHKQLTAELRALDVQEDNLIELAARADDKVPQAKSKIHAKLHDIELRRQHLTSRLTEASRDLTAAARLIELSLKLLTEPQELYRRCDDEQRRLLNQALFDGLYIDHDEVVDQDLREPFALLHALQGQRVSRDDIPTPIADSSDNPTKTQDDERAATRLAGNGPFGTYDLEVLLAGMDLVQGSSKPSMVDLTEALSRSSAPVRQVLQMAETWPTVKICDARHVQPLRTARQLRADEVDELVRVHRSGAKLHELQRLNGWHYGGFRSSPV